MKPRTLAAAIAAIAVVCLAVIFLPIAFPGTAAFRFLPKPKLGLDIQGGARVVLEAQTDKLPPGSKWDDSARQAVFKTLESRVNSNGVSEPVILPKGDKQFIVELPGVKNQQELLDELQNTALLQFYYSPEWKSNRNSSSWRYAMETEPGAKGERDEYHIHEYGTNNEFRDQYHLNQALKDMIERGKSGGVDTALPQELQDLAASAGRISVPLQADDIKALPALADETKNFNAFLSAARLEMTGVDLDPQGAQAGFAPGGGAQAIVSLTFSTDPKHNGRQKFADFTKDHTNEILMIYLDGRILMAPNIDGPILNGTAQISPFSSLTEAKQLADYLNAGSLPVPLKIVQQQSEEATLGKAAVRSGLIAGLVGIGAVILYVIALYRLPGAIACAALLLYTLFTYTIFLLIPVTFTLPGIAGFILSVGMAIDANILIFERTKEELKEGRTLVRAVENGFSRAFSAIFDSNLCTTVTSLLLYNFGNGPVRGFALTLLIGVGLSMFTAITVTRSFLLILVESPAGKSLASWGVDNLWRPKLHTVKNRRWFYLLSLGIIIPGMIALFGGGFKPGIEFTGGSELTLHFSKVVTRDAVEKAVKADGLPEATAQILGEGSVIVRLPKKPGDADFTSAQADDLTAKVATVFPDQQVTREDFSLVGPSIALELETNAFLSIGLSSLFIVCYLTFRFAVGGFVNGLKFGVAAIIAMLHDVLVLAGVFAILGLVLNWKVDSLFVTAALTVIGFSVHDTIVIFDRIRENLKLKGGRVEFSELVNESINETFTRSINTSMTVILTLTALLVLGGAVIRPLNAALLIGIVSGTYSSIFNAAQLVVDWQRKFGGNAIPAPVEPRAVTPRPTTARPTTARPTPGRPATPGARPYTAPPLSPSPASAADRPSAPDESQPGDGGDRPSGGSTLPQAPARRRRRM